MHYGPTELAFGNLLKGEVGEVEITENKTRVADIRRTKIGIVVETLIRADVKTGSHTGMPWDITEEEERLAEEMGLEEDSNLGETWLTPSELSSSSVHKDWVLIGENVDIIVWTTEKKALVEKQQKYY